MSGQELAYEHGIEKVEYEALREDRKEEYATPLIRYWELRCVLCGEMRPGLPGGVGKSGHRHQGPRLSDPDRTDGKRRLHFLWRVSFPVPGRRPHGNPEPGQREGLAE